MRISDWSSDVCSSDLAVLPHFARERAVDLGDFARFAGDRIAEDCRMNVVANEKARRRLQRLLRGGDDANFATPEYFVAGLRSLGRKNVVEGQTVSVRGNVGGRRIHKKKNIKTY